MKSNNTSDANSEPGREALKSSMMTHAIGGPSDLTFVRPISSDGL
jgi:hypothetical protein